MSSAAAPFLLAITIGLVVALIRHPEAMQTGRGRAVALLGFGVLPLAVSALGFSVHLEQAKSTEFCVSCHVMEPYGKSLWYDDTDALPAQHTQNRRLPDGQECYSCHTTYTMFGGARAKLNGLQHLWVYYSGQTPETLELYAPYQNRECLHCHEGARRFESDEIHAELRGELASNEMSCLECHEVVHDIANQESYERYERHERYEGSGSG